MRTVTTLIAMVGDGAGEAARLVGETATNVSFQPAAEVPDDLLERHSYYRGLWRSASSHSSIYTLVDVDPLAEVVEQWSRRLTGDEHDLETAIGLVRSDHPMPDFYLVAPELGTPQIDWYLGLLVRHAPRRVTPVEMTADGVVGALSHMSWGPALPDAARLAGEARTFVPLPAIADHA